MSSKSLGRGIEALINSEVEDKIKKADDITDYVHCAFGRVTVQWGMLPDSWCGAHQKNWSQSIGIRGGV